HDMSTEAIGKRLAPVGQVNIAGEGQNEATTSAAQSEPAAETQQTSASGEEIYEQYCAMCHESGLAGAPKIGDSADWESRIERKGMEKMLSNVVNGYNVMPPKGACMTCDEAQLKAAIEYMLSK
ncbi:MAG: c-type cytochrome, partial [Gammaproteobacteria bacterium]